MERKKRLTSLLRHRVFLSFLISYTLVLLPFYSIWALTNGQAMDAAMSQAAEQKRQQLLSAVAQLDARMRELNTLIDRIALDPATEAFLTIGKLDPNSSDFYGVYSYQKELGVFQEQNLFVSGLYMLSDGSDTLVTNRYATGRFSAINGNGFSFDGMSLNALYEMLRRERYSHTPVLCRAFSDYSAAAPAICVLSSLPYLSNRQSRSCTLMAVVPLESLQDLFESLALEGGQVYLVCGTEWTLPLLRDKGDALQDDEIRALLENNSNRDGMVVTESVSDQTGWHCVLVQSESELMYDLLRLRERFSLILVLSLAAGALLSTALAYWNMNRLRRVVKNIRRAFSGKRDDSRGDMAHIDAILTRLMKNRPDASFQRDLPGQWQYLSRLMHGELMEDSEEMRLMYSLNMCAPSNLFVAVLIQIDAIYAVSGRYSRGELSALNQAVSEYLQVRLHECGALVGFCEMSPGEIGVLMSSNDEAALLEILSERIPAVVNDMEARVRLCCRAAIGGVYRGICTAPQSYEDARAALLSLPFAHGEQRILWPRTESSPDAYSYPMSLEARLINQIRSGKEEQVRQMMAEIAEENVRHRRLSPEMGRQLIYALTNTIRRAMVEQGMDASLFDAQALLVDAESLSGMLSAIENALIALCRRTESENTQDAQRQMGDVVKSIQERFANPDVTIASVAQANDMTEWQLYRLMKAQLGISFSDYLEALRIDRACEMLAGGVRPSDVATQVGYQNDTTFRRAFKRVKGDTPSGYARRSLP